VSTDRRILAADEVDLLPIEGALQPMDQLLALVATLAGHGIRVEHTMHAYRIPADLFERLPGGDVHEWTADRGAVCRSKKIEFGNAVSLILMTTEEAAV
jgi:hypothetical protein